MERVDTRLWELVLVGIGLALIGSAFSQPVFRDPETGATILANPFRFVLTVGPGALVVVMALQLDRFQVDETLLGRVVGWSVFGICIFTGIILLIDGMRLYSTGNASITGFSLQLGAGVVAITGTVVGVSESQRHQPGTRGRLRAHHYEGSSGATRDARHSIRGRRLRHLGRRRNDVHGLASDRLVG